MNNEHAPYPGLQQAWIIFAIFLAASIGIGFLIGALNSVFGWENVSPGNFIGYNVSMAFVIWFAWMNSRKQSEKVLHWNRIPPVFYPLLVILTLSFAIFLDPLTNALPIPEFVEELLKMLAKKDVWTFLMVGITGPILEEVLFRGIILEGFLKRYSPVKAIFWSAFLFGLFHLNPWQFIPGFLIGLLMGYIYYRTRSLIPVVIIHMVNNCFSYLIMYIYGEDVYSLVDLFPERENYYFFFMAASVLFVLSTYMLIIILNKNRSSWTSESKKNSS